MSAIRIWPSLGSYKSKWEAAEERSLQLLEKQMTDRQKALVARRIESHADLVQARRRTLTGRTRPARETAEDARFAGIELTGKHVVILVEMSGSMELVDETRGCPRSGTASVKRW